jgi:HPt (histidine-containing phosphotransfer) domain-containing protein
VDDPELARALEAVWTRHLPETMGRIDRVVTALRALEQDTHRQASRETAAADAHQLIGVASTFGRTELAMLARAAEGLLQRTDALDARDLDQARLLAAQLDRALGH